MAAMTKPATTSSQGPFGEVRKPRRRSRRPRNP
jgi:hypothetical protein